LSPKAVLRHSTGGLKGSRKGMTSLPGNPGHEGFVTPASYLRPHPMTPAAPETAIDRDQRVGLVR